MAWRRTEEQTGAHHAAHRHGDASIRALPGERSAHLVGRRQSAHPRVLWWARRRIAISRSVFYEWWAKARATCPVAIPAGVGFHAFRRKLASELATAPLAMVKAIEGWKHPHIVVAAYQNPTHEQQRAVLDARAKFAAGQ